MNIASLIELIVLAALWGASFLFMRIGSQDFGPIPLIALRTTIAGLCLIPILIFRKKMPDFRANWGAISVLGVINTALPFSLLAFSTLYVTAGFAAILNATTPMFTAILSYLWLKEKLSLTAVMGLFIGFGGVLILIMGKGGMISDDGIIPVLAVLLAAFLYGVSANYTKKKLKGVHPLAIAGGSQISATAVLFIPTVLLWPAETPLGYVWWSVITLGIACTGIAYILYFRLIENIGPAKTVMVTYLIPAFGMVWGRIFLQEVITLNMLLGFLVILTGIVLTSGFFQRKKKKDASALVCDGVKG